jgi:hypothetical protein
MLRFMQSEHYQSWHLQHQQQQLQQQQHNMLNHDHNMSSTSTSHQSHPMVMVNNTNHDVASVQDAGIFSWKSER